MYTDLQSVASPLGHSTLRSLAPRDRTLLPIGTGRDSLRADDGIRTRDPHLGKVMLYQLSHVRASCQPPPGAIGTLAEAKAGVQTCPRWHPAVLSISQPDHCSADTLTRCSSPHPLRSSSLDSQSLVQRSPLRRSAPGHGGQYRPWLDCWRWCVRGPKGDRARARLPYAGTWTGSLVPRLR